MKPHRCHSNMLRATALTCGDTPVVGTRTGMDHTYGSTRFPDIFGTGGILPDSIKQTTIAYPRDRAVGVLFDAVQGGRHRLRHPVFVRCFGKL